jgi:hypothetical protein
MDDLGRLVLAVSISCVFVLALLGAAGATYATNKIEELERRIEVLENSPLIGHVEER